MPVVKRKLADGTVVYQAQVRMGKDAEGNWIRRSATRDTRREAAQQERLLLAEAEQNRANWMEPNRLTYRAYFQQWLARREKRLGDTTTMDDYRRIVRLHIEPVLGDRLLRDVRTVDIQRLLDRMGPKRITEYTRGVLVDALRQAVELGLVPMNAAKGTECPPRAKAERPSFALAEGELLFRAAEGTRLAHLLQFCYFTGLRRGEALGLRWGDLSGDPPFLTVCRQVGVKDGKAIVKDGTKETNKSGREVVVRTREVPLILHAQRALRAQRDLQAEEKRGAREGWAEEDWVFPNVVGGAWDPNNFSNMYRALWADREAGVLRALPDGPRVPFRPFHATRHSAASVLLGAGVEPALAAKIMGHRDLRTFYTTYADLLQPAAQGAARQVEAFLEAAERQGEAPAQAQARTRRGRPRGHAG